jgi:hypothetical protein
LEVLQKNEKDFLPIVEGNKELRFQEGGFEIIEEAQWRGLAFLGIKKEFRSIGTLNFFTLGVIT